MLRFLILFLIAGTALGQNIKTTERWNPYTKTYDITLKGDGVKQLATTAQSVGEGTLGTVTWDGTPPSGTTTKVFRWARSGNLVTFTAQAVYGTAGTSNTTAYFVLPSDIPAPLNLSTSASNGTPYYCAGGTETAVSNLTAGGTCGLNWATTEWRVYMIAASKAAKMATCTCTYIVAFSGM